MHIVPLFCVLVMCVTSIYSVTISTPRAQRKCTGESTKFLWKVTGDFTSYTVSLDSTALGPNSNLSSSNGAITLTIWNIRLENAGYYSLSINTGLSTEVNSTVLLFVYAMPYAYVFQSAGRNPSYGGDTIELNCSSYSASLPASEQPKMYYFWYIRSYGLLRNISSGPAVLQNGDVVPGYSIKNDGKTFVIESAQYADSYYCSVQEEGSPYKNLYNNYFFVEVYSKPYAYSFSPASRRLTEAFGEYISFSFRFHANPGLTSYTNWSFVNAYGSVTEYPVGSDHIIDYVNSSPAYVNFNSYGNYSITLTNSNGSTTTTFQVLPPGPPDTPSNFSVEYLTNSRIWLQWRCMWRNGAQQTVYVRLSDAETNAEVETKYLRLDDQNCYNFRYSTLFQRNIQPETSYEASIWSTNSLGSSNVDKFVLRTPRPLKFVVSPSNISILENEATINYLILNSNLTLIRLNVTCCVEVTAECSNKSYILANTDNSFLYDILPTGTEYVFDFVVFDTDGYTYEYILTILKGVRVSTVKTTTEVTTTPATCLPCEVDTRPCVFNETKPLPLDNGNPLYVPVIVLAVLLGVAVLVLLSCSIGLLVCKCRRKNML